MVLPAWSTVSVRPSASAMLPLPDRPVLALISTSPVLALVVLKLALAATVPPYTLIGPATLIAPSRVMSAVLVDLPMVSALSEPLTGLLKVKAPLKLVDTGSISSAPPLPL